MNQTVDIFSLVLSKEAQVSPYQQETQWTCSAACLKAVLSHYGMEATEEELRDLIGAKPKRGAEVDEIVAAAHKLGLEAFDYLFASLDQAKILLDQDIPIICDIQSFNHEGKGHYVVLTKIDGDEVHLMDPNTPGNQRVLTREHMDVRWWDHRMAPPHDLVEKWGVVVLPPEKP